MKVFVVEFEGFWPIGASAVVVARDKVTARIMVERRLKDMEFDNIDDRLTHVTEIHTDHQNIGWIDYGDY